MTDALTYVTVAGQVLAGLGGIGAFGAAVGLWLDVLGTMMRDLYGDEDAGRSGIVPMVLRHRRALRQEGILEGGDQR